ncbi:MAG: hypothetical protein OQK75_00620 [Gammaproteobacteria bacterium]|nr:hypothetical protein [Gammaproteobacteria bacterium]MCW8986148.1 hypothetical protein [Gammaproteobacteria bacterium]MCW9030939.1 hypothetical protein [Gammaproteobacteria bacterium]
MKRLIWIISAALALFFTSNIYAAEAELLHANEWSVPKQANTILAMPAVRKSMKKLQMNVNSSLKLKYPGGDEGTLWVNELRSWLIALGLSSKRIELIPGSAISTTIELEVLTN